MFSSQGKLKLRVYSTIDKENKINVSIMDDAT